MKKWGCMLATALFGLSAACGDDDGGASGGTDSGSTPVSDGGTMDGSTADASTISVGPGEVACGDAVCVAGADADWGGMACCVDAEQSLCGIQADDPFFDINGMIITVAEFFNFVVDRAGMGGDGGVSLNTNPMISCQAKNQPGELSPECPAVNFLTGPIAGSEMILDLRDLSDDAGIEPIDFLGCCRPDGMCGYADDADGGTGFGCIKISDSLVGTIQGTEDITCTP